MTQGNAATVQVGLLQGVTQILGGLCHHGSEGLVDLHEVQVLHGPAGLLQSRGDGLGRLGDQGGIRASGLAVFTEGGQDLEAVVLGVLAGGQHHGSCTVGDLGRRSRGDGAILDESGAQLAQTLDGGTGADAFVGVHRDGFLAGLHLHGSDLLSKNALLGGSLCALVGLSGDFVLLFAGQSCLGSVAIGLETHGGAVDGISEAIALQGVCEVEGAEALTCTYARCHVWSVGHGLLTAGYNNLGIAQADEAGGVDDRVQARKTDLVDGQRGHVDRHASLNGGLLSWVLTGTSLHNLAHEHVINGVGGNLCAV